MTLYDCNVGDECRIVGFKTDDYALKDRFISFGIVKDRECRIVNYSLRRLAVAVVVGGMQIALRDSEARSIGVEPLESVGAKQQRGRFK